METTNKLKHKKRHWLVEGVVSLLPALIFVLMIRSVFLESFKIPSGSMIPTLYIGDQLFINKASYGIRVPFSDWTNHSIYLMKFSPPRRGDIIVFLDPKDTSRHLIKRVIGTPGDTVEMRDKVIYVNGTALERAPEASDKIEKYLKDLSDNPRYQTESLIIQKEKFRDDLWGTIMINKDAHYSESFPPTTVPADHYFCMGDNRDDSADSRYWGFVPFNYIKGRAAIVWFSIWLDFDKGSVTFHPERIGNILH